MPNITLPRLLRKDGTTSSINPNYSLNPDADPAYWTKLTSSQDHVLTARYYEQGGNPFGRKVPNKKNASRFTIEPIRMRTLDDVYDARLATRPGQCWISGEPFEWVETPVARIADAKKDGCFFNGAARWIFILDFDDVFETGDWLKDPKGLFKRMIDLLPKQFRGAGGVFMPSGSMTTNGPAHAHIAFAGSRPVWDIELLHWLSPYQVDTSPFTAVQRMNTAPPVFYDAEGKETGDPLRGERTQIYDGPPVEIPDTIYEHAKPRQYGGGGSSTVRVRPPWREMIGHIPTTFGRRHTFIRDELVPGFCHEEWSQDADRNEKLQLLTDAILSSPAARADRARFEDHVANDLWRIFNDNWDPKDHYRKSTQRWLDAGEILTAAKKRDEQLAKLTDDKTRIKTTLDRWSRDVVEGK